MIIKHFEEQVMKHPDQLAIKTNSDCITYSELNQAANRVARQIVQNEEEVKTIGLLFEHGSDMIVGMLSALKAGKIYVPLDATYPIDRLAYIVEDADINVVITNSQNETLFKQFVLEVKKPMEIINIDTVPDTVSSDNLNLPIPEDQIAYLLYTSGSTGRPKGVIQSRENVVYFVKNYIKDFSITPNDRLTLFSAFGHDAAVMDIYGGLLSGATLYPVNIKNKLNMRDMVNWLIDEKITIWHSVPTVFRYFYQTLTGDKQLPDLRLIILGGEQVLDHDVQMFKQLFAKPTRLANLYGQSESSYNSVQMIETDSPFKKVTLGQVIEGSEILLIDEDGMEVSTLGKGEILVVSNHVALGYWKDEERTEKAFGYDPEMGRFYWTGDLGRLLADGSIEFLGRKDFQIKIRGYRVELGEIESALLQHEAVKEAVVVVKEDKMGEKVLCACIVPKHQEIQLDLRSYISQKLPDYMVPSHFLLLAEMPLTSTNKIDRTALLKLEFSQASQREYIPPRDAVEEQVAKIWSAVLGVEKVGIEDHFFELGGHSLKATALIENIYQQMNVELPLIEVFNRPTVKELAEWIRGAEASMYRLLEPVAKREYYPVSFAQQGMYLLNQREGDTTSYNMPGIFKVHGTLDRERFELAFQSLIQRHEVLRTSFAFHKGELIQRVHDHFDFQPYYDQAVNRSEVELTELVAKFVKPFDLRKAPLLRVGLIQTAEDEYIFMYDLPHIIADAVSMLILMNEFIQLYSGRELPSLRIQYKDFAVWQNEIYASEIMQKQKVFWENIFKNNVPVLNMPLDYQRPEVQTFEGSVIRKNISKEVMQKLNDFALQENVTLNMLLLSIYALLLNKYTNQADLTVGLIVSGRQHKDFRNVIGMFANFLPLRFTVNADQPFQTFLQSARELILQAYEHQNYPFDQIVENLSIPIDHTRNPLFDTMFILHNENEMQDEQKIDGLEFSRFDFYRTTSKLDFKIDAFETDQGELACNLEYNINLFTEETMQGFMDHFTQLIEAIVEYPEKYLNELDVFSPEEAAKMEEKRNPKVIKENNGIPLVVSATFTAEPIESYVKWWCNQFHLEVDMHFASYNQVFQELLDPKSRVSVNTGANIILVRFEDWIRDDQSADSVLSDKLERNYKELVEIIQNKEKPVPYLVGIFPVSTHLSLSETVLRKLKDLTIRWKDRLGGMENVFVLDFTDLAKLYGISDVFDQKKDQVGHLPFTDEYYAAMGTMIARKVYAWQKQHFKVIVLDCDNTLWQGVCGEDGPLGVQITEPYLAFQQLLVQKYNEGMMLALCSKNNESDAWEVFEKNPGMVLKKEHFVNWRINWQAKSENIKQIAAELNLGVDSFIFVDDSPMECSEVMTHCPEVLTLQLPEDNTLLPLFMEHVWALDRFKVTAEDQSRTQMYVAERNRQKEMESKHSLTDFLKGLELKLSMRLMEEPQLTRVAQLTQRTNQFNLSTIRRTEEEIEGVIQSGYNCWIVEVIDRFGEYGLVGVIIGYEHQANLFIDSFILSCRALGRGVEEAILVGLKQYCQRHHLHSLEADFYPTAKNKPLLEFLERTNWQQVGETDQYVKYILPCDAIPETIEFIDCYYDAPYEKNSVVDDNDQEVYRLDHIAIAVANLAEAQEAYRNQGYECGPIVHDPIQNANLMICTKDGSDRIELVAPVNENSPCNRILEKNGEIPYHLCYQVKKFNHLLDNLHTNKIMYEIISEAQPAVLFNNQPVMFIFVQGVGLIELLEVSASAEHNISKMISKKTMLQIVIPDMEKALSFYQAIGYTQERSIRDSMRNVASVILQKEGAGKIELIVPLDATTEEYQFLQKNGAHPYRLSRIEQVESDQERVNHFTAVQWQVNVVNREKLRHADHLLPLENSSALQLLNLPIYQVKEKHLHRAEYLAPSNEIERRLVAIWTALLGVEGVGIQDNFFKLGGHSLKATSLISRVYKEFEVEITLREIFERPTIQELAEYIHSADKKTYFAIEKVEDREFYPVSAAQRRLFVLNQLESDNTSYNLPGAVVLDGEVDQQRLEDAFKTLIQRHESLRTSFDIVEDELVQRVHPEVDFKINYLNVRESEIGNTLSGLLQPFDLSQAPLLRVALVESEKQKILAFDMYHIIADGISRDILFKEFIELYEGHQLPELHLQYRDFAIWQNELLERKGFKESEEYWLDQFLEDRTQREIPVLNLPYDYARPLKQSFAGDQVEFEIGEERVQRLHALAKATNSTLYICLLALYNVLLANYSGQEDIIVGTPIAGRPNAELENIIGMFVNTLALRNYPEANKSFREFLLEVRERTLTAFENQYYQFDALIDQLDLARDLSRNPLFDTMFRLQNYHDGAIQKSELQCSPYKLENKVSQFDLQLTCVEVGGKLACTFEYATKLFHKETIEQMSKHFTQIMQDILNHPDQLLAEVELLTPEEKAVLLDTLNDTKVDYAKAKVIHELFEEQAVNTPEQIAVIAGNDSLTYRELNQRANQLAHYLREKGVQRETVVGLMVERSISMMVGIFGVLKAGGAYLPIDPVYPVERIEYMLADSEAQVLLTQSNLVDKVNFAGEQICLDDPTIFASQTGNVENINQSSDLIYLIYTSGSTGKPKGTMLEHRSVHNFMTGIKEVIPFAVNKRVLSLTTVSFDIFVLETLLPLTNGASVVLATEEEQRDSNHIAALILQHKVDLAQFTPSRLQLLLEQEQATEVLGALKEILVGGEAFPEALLSKLRDVTNARIFNMYGPTETTVWSTMKELTQAEKVSIGTPLANTQIYLLNQNLKLVPAKVIGELYIAGDGLARGYHKQLDLTKERFVENPYVPGKRMYRTGDLARWLGDGNIEFIGRKDQQVKLRGYRIETGEIEYYLNQFEGIKESVVVVRKLADGSSDLVGYYVAKEGIPVSELRSHLLKTLPDYMVPTFYHQLTQLPLTPNGKIDRKALPTVEGNRPYLEQNYQAPETEIENVIANICKEMLKIDLVGVHDNFFDLGGNSMLLVQMHRRLHKVFPGKITIGDIFAYPTVARLAEHLASKVLILSNNSEEEKEYWMYELAEPVQLLPLPVDYRSEEKGASKENLFRFQLKPEVTQRLVEIAQREKVDVYDILTGMYMYILSEITAKTDVLIAAARKEDSRVFPIRIKLEELRQIQDLFTMIGEKYAKLAQMQMDPMQTMLKERMSEDTFLPLFCSRYDISFHPYELIVNAEISKESIAFGCRYQSLKFKRAKVEEFIKKYVKLLEIMIQQYFSEK